MLKTVQSLARTRSESVSPPGSASAAESNARCTSHEETPNEVAASMGPTGADDVEDLCACDKEVRKRRV